MKSARENMQRRAQRVRRRLKKKLLMMQTA